MAIDGVKMRSNARYVTTLAKWIVIMSGTTPGFVDRIRGRLNGHAGRVSDGKPQDSRAFTLATAGD